MPDRNPTGTEHIFSINSGTEHRAGGGVSIREKGSRARSLRGGVSENWIAGSAAASLFFLTAIAIATRPFKFHENSVAHTSSSFVFSIHSLNGFRGQKRTGSQIPIPQHCAVINFSNWST